MSETSWVWKRALIDDGEEEKAVQIFCPGMMVFVFIFVFVSINVFVFGISKRALIDDGEQRGRGKKQCKYSALA